MSRHWRMQSGCSDGFKTHGHHLLRPLPGQRGASIPSCTEEGESVAAQEAPQSRSLQTSHFSKDSGQLQGGFQFQSEPCGNSSASDAAQTVARLKLGMPGLAPTAVESTDEIVSMVSFNVLASAATNTFLSGEGKGRNKNENGTQRDARYGRSLEFLEKQNADLVFLQEVDTYFYGRLQAALFFLDTYEIFYDKDGKYVGGEFEKNPTGGAALLVAKTLRPQSAKRVVYRPRGAGINASVVAVALDAVTIDGNPVWVASTHLPNMRKAGAADQIQEMLCRGLQDLLPNAVLIVAGDMNRHAGQAETTLKTVWRETDDYHVGNLADLRECQKFFPHGTDFSVYQNNPAGAQLDHLFVVRGPRCSKKTSVVKGKLVSTGLYSPLHPFDRNNTWGSDHLPVKMNLAMERVVPLSARLKRIAADFPSTGELGTVQFSFRMHTGLLQATAEIKRVIASMSKATEIQKCTAALNHILSPSQVESIKQRRPEGGYTVDLTEEQIFLLLSAMSSTFESAGSGRMPSAEATVIVMLTKKQCAALCHLIGQQVPAQIAVTRLADGLEKAVRRLLAVDFDNALITITPSPPPFLLKLDFHLDKAV